MPSHFTDKQMGTHPRLPSQEQRPHCTLPSWPPLQGKPANQKGFVKPLHLVRLGAWTQRHHPPVQSETRALNQPGWKPATKDVCSVPLICGPGFFFFFFLSILSQDSGNCVFRGSSLCPTPYTHQEDWWLVTQTRPHPLDHFLWKMKGAGSPERLPTPLSMQEQLPVCRAGRPFPWRQREVPLQVTDTRPPCSSLGLPPVAAAASPTTEPAEPSGLRSERLGSAPLISPRPGKFPDSGHQEPSGAGGAGHKAWEQILPGVAEGM